MKLVTMFAFGALILSPFTQANAPQKMTQQQIDAMVAFSVQQMHREGEFSSMSQCTGVSAQKLEQAFRHSLSTCFSHHSVDEHKMDACFKQEIIAQTGLSQSTIDNCAGENDVQDEQITQLEVQIEKLERDIEHTEEHALSDTQTAQLEDKMAQLDHLYTELHQLQDQAMYGQLSENEKRLEKLYQELGDNAPTAAQEAKMKQLMDAIALEKQQELSQLMQVIGDSQRQ
ncbi:hypothetical protein [Shewanella maritima]|uniref:hypothetical protein n=1 Tax=Shewanella maritima TaxID=2520507 RepID=UPI003735824F